MSEVPAPGRNKKGQFVKGESGNPVGRPKGSKNHIIAMKLAMEEHIRANTDPAEIRKIVRSMITEAIAGDVTDTNVMRALTRAGMGRCQGRNCASHVAATIARRTGQTEAEVELPTVRPPLKPVTIAAIASEREQHEKQADLY